MHVISLKRGAAAGGAAAVIYFDDSVNTSKKYPELQLLISSAMLVFAIFQRALQRQCCRRCAHVPELQYVGTTVAGNSHQLEGPRWVTDSG